MTKKPRENRIPIMMADEELSAIDDWRFANRIATRSDAVRRLVQIALTFDREAGALLSLAEGTSTRTRELVGHFMNAPRELSETDSAAVLDFMTSSLGATRDVLESQSELSYRISSLGAHGLSLKARERETGEAIKLSHEVQNFLERQGRKFKERVEERNEGKKQ
ncbi:hypothetical protein [Mesorhizobium sp. B2-8-3]|uniref:hypothetical protein n=1 Tax=Mesorhizobium sp. B2-8-3 TaxID=2589905 RepID=UPI00112E14CE|nr:hypothetical protein [Mesorhizobium sp. B2-8-3]TPJ27162.1 hypothetical protein FJ418_28775 [Mesorhizobium sp. B2-8-3]